MKKPYLVLVALLAFSANVFAGTQVLEDNVEKGHFSQLNVSSGLSVSNAGGKATLVAEYKTYIASDAVASGQTSKAVTVTGITTAAKCVVTPAEVGSNAAYIRAAVVTANTVTVTVSADPGASNLDIVVVCFE